MARLNQEIGGHWTKNEEGSNPANLFSDGKVLGRAGFECDVQNLLGGSQGRIATRANHFARGMGSDEGRSRLRLSVTRVPFRFGLR